MARRGIDATTSEGAPGEPRRPAWWDDAPVRIGISSCLLGQRVRWDGGHKRDPFLTEQLAPFVEWVPVCPELEMGMGVPREPIQLVARDDGDPDAAPRLVGARSGRDWTRAMRTWSRRRVRALAALDLSGYVLKARSPSCGMERVPVWGAAGRAARRGRGLFARTLLETFPLLPVEEEGRLADPLRRDRWLERVFAFRRLRALFAGRWTRDELAAFHAAHELQLRAHSPRRCAELGRLVTAGELGRLALRRRYSEGFLEALRVPVTPQRHEKTLRHVERRLLRFGLDARARRELDARIADYARGRVPLRVPLVLARRQVARLGVASLAGQTWLEPQPSERVLRELA